MKFNAHITPYMPACQAGNMTAQALGTPQAAHTAWVTWPMFYYPRPVRPQGMRGTAVFPDRGVPYGSTRGRGCPVYGPTGHDDQNG
jgi:hypothetical protein